jgi:hypothetical protein
MNTQIDHGSAIVLHAAAATLPIPTTAASGEAVFEQWGSASDEVVVLCIDSDAPGTITNAKLYGYDEVDTKWRLIAEPNNGLSIAMVSSGAIIIGYEERFIDIGKFSRLAMSASISAGNITVSVKKITEIGA